VQVGAEYAEGCGEFVRKHKFRTLLIHFSVDRPNLNFYHLKINEEKTALIVSTLASFITPFMASSLNVALPVLGKEFSLDAISLGWIATAYLLSAAVLLIPFGRLADTYGRKKIFIWGISVYSLFSFLLPFSPSGAVLIAMRIFQGIGAAMIFCTGVAILISAIPASSRGKALGINVASVYLGLSLGPFIGGFLTQSLTWRSIFFVNGFFGLIILWLTAWKLKGEWADEHRGSFDITGSILLCASLTLLMIGSSRLHLPSGPWMAAGGIASGIFFVLWEKRADYPILDIKLFSDNRAFASSNLAALINYSATAAVTFLLSLYLQNVKGLSPSSAGIVLVSQPVCMTLVSPLAGRMSDKIEPRYIASLGMALTVIGLFFFSFIGTDTSLVHISLNLVLLGVGFGLFSSPNTNAIMSSVPRAVYGVASATVGTMRLSGQMLSMGIVMVMLSLSVGSSGINAGNSAGFLGTMRDAFIVFAAVCFIGIFFSLARGNIRGTSRQ
jgi:EmrB/QacA subfamily drug resistance transporter